jgi:hypothetical protein
MSSRLERIAWKEKILDQLADLGEEGRFAAEYLRAHKTYIGFWKARKNVGAFWTFLRTIHFNSFYYSMNMEMNNIDMLTLLIHEVKHLQQGMIRALSVYGELEAWQLQFRLYHQFSGKPMHPVIVEMMSLPLTYDRVVLRRARDLMQAYAGKGYRADLLPLFPLGKEIKYWLRMRPVSIV